MLYLTTATAADELLSSDSNALRHDAAGVVSIANGGGTFEFTVTPGPNGQLDATHTVIGQVRVNDNELIALQHICSSTYNRA